MTVARRKPECVMWVKGPGAYEAALNLAHASIIRHEPALPDRPFTLSKTDGLYTVPSALDDVGLKDAATAMKEDMAECERLLAGKPTHEVLSRVTAHCIAWKHFWAERSVDEIDRAVFARDAAYFTDQVVELRATAFRRNLERINSMTNRGARNG